MNLDSEDIEAIASRVVELLLDQRPTAARLVDAATVASALGVDRDWVYTHAHELGATRLGGARGRRRFDLAKILQDLATPADSAAKVPARRSRSGSPPARRRPAQQEDGRTELIPYHAVRCTGQRKRPADARTPPARHREAPRCT
jgi:hypothetical protein